MKKIVFLSIVSISIFTSCKKKVGCTDSAAINYDSSAEKENNSCNYKGKVTFWTKTDSILNNVDVTVNGATKTITTHYASNPGCGSSGCATYELTPGNYSFHAMEQGTAFMWTSQITITSQGCLSLELHH